MTSIFLSLMIAICITIDACPEGGYNGNAVRRVQANQVGFLLHTAAKGITVLPQEGDPAAVASVASALYSASVSYTHLTLPTILRV